MIKKVIYRKKKSIPEGVEELVEDSIVVFTEGTKKKEHILVDKKPGYKYFIIKIIKINVDEEEHIQAIVGYVDA